MHPKPRISYILQFAILLCLVGVFMVVASLIAGVIASAVLHVPLLQLDKAFKQAENADFVRWMNVITTFFVLFLPAVIYARIVSPQPFRLLGFNRVISGKQVFIIVLMVIAAMMLSTALGQLAQDIPLPARWLDKAKKFEEEYNDAVMVMAKMNSMKEYLIALVVIAFFPAVFEEVLFRGGLQQVLVKWTKSPWAGIIITSILFSAFHLSYFGFFARAGLGIVLGLIFYYSRNIWLNILLHFLNNAFLVTAMYAYSKSGMSEKELQKATDPTLPFYLIWLLFSAGLLVMLFRAFKKESERIGANNIQLEVPPIDHNPFGDQQ